ncbi:MAG: hypothetical protein GXO35_03755 [Gammaproteobacteria bacterium]|nr:hypothetical protein [Gammaproteobacteria bacterium]
MDELMEYVFFDLSLAERFKAYCESLEVAATLKSDVTYSDIPEFTVSIADDLAEAQTEKIEELYAELLFGEQASMIEGNDEQGAVADACGVQVQLASGIYTTVAIHPETMNKILSVLSIGELQTFLSQVAEDIENPKTGPICSREDLPTT